MQDNIKHWQIEDDKLVRELNFKNFMIAIQFINFIKLSCEQQNHHPDLLLHSYKKLKIILYTHTQKTITQKDYQLAKTINQLWQDFKKDI